MKAVARKTRSGRLVVVFLAVMVFAGLIGGSAGAAPGDTTPPDQASLTSQRAGTARPADQLEPRQLPAPSPKATANAVDPRENHTPNWNSVPKSNTPPVSPDAVQVAPGVWAKPQYATAAQASSWWCETYIANPQQVDYSTGDRFIIAKSFVDCSVAVQLWIYACIQVGNYNRWYDQAGGGSPECGWTYHGTTFEANTLRYHYCSGRNPWFYRQRGYSYKIWPDGYSSYSPQAISSFIYSYC